MNTESVGKDVNQQEMYSNVRWPDFARYRRGLGLKLVLVFIYVSVHHKRYVDEKSAVT